MNGFAAADGFAICFFALAWIGYHLILRRNDGSALNARMTQYRMLWMQEMADRDVRIVDASLMASLQNGTAFFASTSLLALGGSATLLRTGDEMLRIAAELPLGVETTRAMFEIKVIGLLVIFGYCFFKFTWAYRLFNYCAILIGATPAAKSPDESRRREIAAYAGRMNIAAARQFTRGQRGFFFSLAYLGWFLGPYAMMAATLLVVFVMWIRQYRSEAHDAILPGASAQQTDAS